MLGKRKDDQKLDGTMNVQTLICELNFKHHQVCTPVNGLKLKSHISNRQFTLDFMNTKKSWSESPNSGVNTNTEYICEGAYNLPTFGIRLKPLFQSVQKSFLTASELSITCTMKVTLEKFAMNRRAVWIFMKNYTRSASLIAGAFFCHGIRPVREMKGWRAIPTSLALSWDTMANQPLN